MGYVFKIPEGIASAASAFSHIVERVNFLLSFAKAFASIEGKGGVKVTVSEANVVIDSSGLTSRIIQEVAARSKNPFTITPVTGAAKVTIWPGDVGDGTNTLIPKIGATFINTSPAPELTISASGSVYIKATMDAVGVFTDAVIESASSLPTDTSTLRHRRIGTVTLSGVVVTVTAQTVTTSVSHRLCAGTSTWGQQ